jgi:folate-binding protein YgfZ
MFVLRARVELVADDSLAVLGDESGLEPGASAPGNCWTTAAGPAYCVMPKGNLPADSGSASAWKAAELERGVAWLDERTSERFIPQMLGFDRIGAVSFSKGCYPGQEVIARARYLGRVKRGPLQLLLETEADVAKAIAASVDTGASVALEVSDDRLDATVVDQVLIADGRLVLFLVAPLSDAEPAAIEIDGRSYRCATI